MASLSILRHLHFLPQSRGHSCSFAARSSRHCELGRQFERFIRHFKLAEFTALEIEIRSRSRPNTKVNKMSKSISPIVCLVLVVAALSGAPGEARPKRSVYYAAAPVVAAVPVVQHSQVVHTNPTTVVKTEQVRSGNHASYSYSTETKTQPIVHTAAVAAGPVATVAHVAPVAGVVPTSAYYATHHYGYYPHAAYYSPFSYVIGK